MEQECLPLVEHQWSMLSMGNEMAVCQWTRLGRCIGISADSFFRRVMED
jgi:hypothetical protein